MLLLFDIIELIKRNNMKKINYNPSNHGSFEVEWGIHKNCREWWYATGILFDEEGNMYSYQYTLLHLAFGFIIPKVAMVALTDCEPPLN